MGLLWLLVCGQCGCAVFGVCGGFVCGGGLLVSGHAVSAVVLFGVDSGCLRWSVYFDCLARVMFPAVFITVWFDGGFLCWFWVRAWLRWVGCGGAAVWF